MFKDSGDSFIFIIDEWDSIFYKDFMTDADKNAYLSFLKNLLKEGYIDDSNMPTTEITAEQLTDGAIGIMDLMLACKLVPSKSEARRLIQQGGVFVNDNKVEAIDFKVTEEMLKENVKIRKGKKKFHKAIMQ